MPGKHPNTARIGGPGASHENRKQPEKSPPRAARTEDARLDRPSKVTGDGTKKASPVPALKGGRK